MDKYCSEIRIYRVLTLISHPYTWQTLLINHAILSLYVGHRLRFTLKIALLLLINVNWNKRWSLVTLCKIDLCLFKWYQQTLKIKEAGKILLHSKYLDITPSQQNLSYTYHVSSFLSFYLILYCSPFPGVVI